MDYQFFQALEQSGSVHLSRGWQPQHLVLNNSNEKNTAEQVSAILPLYLKQHSWGEYVFDWSWADAYQQYNLAYYPKLVATIPFTPVTTNKLLTKQQHHQQQQCFEHLSNHCQQNNINSWHLLFSPKIDLAKLELSEQVMQRTGVQFHWFNENYQSFEHFLAKFTARKRKNTRKERQSIKQQKVHIRQVQGKNISTQELEFFYLTYQLTYLKNGHQPHLSFEFFQQIFNSLADNILLIIAKQNNKDIACALFFYDQENLYGRYWGCTEKINNLHFELCYYQGIDFCIQQGIKRFNPGTQGEHKIQRGFQAVFTYSYHWLKQPQFQHAIKDFCLREQRQVEKYQQQCLKALPFKCQQQ